MHLRFLLTSILLLLSPPALAYLDPVSGSVIVQGLIAAVAGALVAIKAYWHRIKAFFRGSDVDSAERAPGPEDGPGRGPE